MTNELTTWLVFRTAEEARHASQHNGHIVLARTPDEAREICEARAPANEQYGAGYNVMSLSDALASENKNGCLTIRGDIANGPPLFPASALGVWVF